MTVGDGHRVRRCCRGPALCRGFSPRQIIIVAVCLSLPRVWPSAKSLYRGLFFVEGQTHCRVPEHFPSANPQVLDKDALSGSARSQPLAASPFICARGQRWQHLWKLAQNSSPFFILMHWQLSSYSYIGSISLRRHPLSFSLEANVGSIYSKKTKAPQQPKHACMAIKRQYRSCTTRTPHHACARMSISLPALTITLPCIPLHVHVS